MGYMGCTSIPQRGPGRGMVDGCIGKVEEREREQVETPQIRNVSRRSQPTHSEDRTDMSE